MSRLENWVRIGGLIQVAVVVLGVGFTFWEFVLKDRDFLRLQRETTVRLILDQAPTNEEQEAYNSLSNAYYCDPKNAPVAWACPSKESFKLEELSDWITTGKIMRPIYAHLSRIAVCVKAGLCDFKLSHNLACADFRIYGRLSRWLKTKTKVPPIDEGTAFDEFLKECSGGPYKESW